MINFKGRWRAGQPLKFMGSEIQERHLGTGDPQKKISQEKKRQGRYSISRGGAREEQQRAQKEQSQGQGGNEKNRGPGPGEGLRTDEEKQLRRPVGPVS